MGRPLSEVFSPDSVMGPGLGCGTGKVETLKQRKKGPGDSVQENGGVGTLGINNEAEVMVGRCLELDGDTITGTQYEWSRAGRLLSSFWAYATLLCLTMQLASGEGRH